MKTLRGLRAALCVIIAAYLLPAYAQGLRNHARDKNEPKIPLTVAASIETTRAMTDKPPRNEAVFYSRDRSQFLVMLIRGDLALNGNWIELKVGRLDAPYSQIRLESVAKVFTTSLGAIYGYGLADLTYPGSNVPVWLDDGKHVAFLAEDENHLKQVAIVDTQSHTLYFATRHQTSVQSFAIGPRDTIVYSAQASHSNERSLELRSRGFSVSNPDAFGAVRGDIDGYGLMDQLWNSHWFLQTDKAPPKSIETGSRGYNGWPPLIQSSYSPDGQFALIDGSPDSVRREWDDYIGDRCAKAIRESRENWSDSFQARELKEIYVLAIDTGVAHALWDVPTACDKRKVVLAWSPDSRRVLIGPTFLPERKGGDDGLRGNAIATVDIQSGQFSIVPVPGALTLQGMSFVWEIADRIVITDSHGMRHRYVEMDGRWEAQAAVTQDSVHLPQIDIELRQNINDPPAFYAVNRRSGETRMILDLNPELRSLYSLGRATMVEWLDEEQRAWHGRLYYPVNYDRTTRYPLVIQTHGVAAQNAFSLYGLGYRAPGVGPGWSVYAAQTLANHGIAVLQMEDYLAPDVLETPKEADVHMRGYEGAVRHLVEQGVVNGDKVGIVGFSRTGWHVEFALTHSTLNFAAAIMSDGIDGNYGQEFLGPTVFDNIIGAKPFGDGLKTWLASAPAFNAEKIRTPLRLQVESDGLPGLLGQWEMFSRLRRLSKPVELYAIPDVDHGSHGVQNPAQCYALQQGAVDWFDFWLNGHEDPDPSKAEQYARWQKLRELQKSQEAARNTRN